MRRFFSALVWVAMLTSGAALAHAYLDSASPAPNSVITEAPETIEMRFSMPIETRFSTFKVYRLAVAEEAMPADLAQLTQSERQRLNALAAQLVARVLELDDAEAEARVDTGLLTDARTAAELTLSLREGLEQGVYVVMWEVLAIDTHWSKEHLVFFLVSEGR